MIKISVIFILTLSVTCAEVESWTDQAGRSAQMELLAVSREGEIVSGQFRLKDNSRIWIPSTKLSEADSQKLSEWKLLREIDAATFLGGRPKYVIFQEEGWRNESESSITFDFKFSVFHMVGFKNDSLSIRSCSLSKIRKTHNPSPLSRLGFGTPFTLTRLDASDQIGQSGKGAKNSWVLENGPSLVTTDEQGVPSHERSLSISLLSEDRFSDEQIQACTFESDVVVGLSTTTRSEVVSFKRNEIGRKGVKKTGSFSIWLMEDDENPFEEPSENSPKILAVYVDDSYEPSCVKTVEISANGKPVRKLAEVASPEIDVKVTYWTDIKNMKLICSKKSP